jgi:hypothetical protein
VLANASAETAVMTCFVFTGFSFRMRGHHCRCA